MSDNDKKNNPCTPAVVVDKSIAIFNNTKGDELIHSSVLIDTVTRQISNVGAPVSPNDVATKAYVDAHSAGGPTLELSQYLLVGHDGGANAIYVTATNSNPQIILKSSNDSQVTVEGVGGLLNVLGTLATSGDILITGHIGVGNSAAASIPGSIVKKIQIFDQGGNSLGYLPVYNSIT